MNCKKFAGGVAMVAGGVILAVVIVNAYENVAGACRRWWRERRENDTD